MRYAVQLGIPCGPRGSLHLPTPPHHNTGDNGDPARTIARVEHRVASCARYVRPPRISQSVLRTYVCTYLYARTGGDSWVESRPRPRSLVCLPHEKMADSYRAREQPRRRFSLRARLFLYKRACSARDAVYTVLAKFYEPRSALCGGTRPRRSWFPRPHATRFLALTLTAVVPFSGSDQPDDWT